MDSGEAQTEAFVPSNDSETFIVKADEVDDAGADISTISLDDASTEEEFNARIEQRRLHDLQLARSPKLLATATSDPPSQSPRRQPLARNTSTSLPPVRHLSSKDEEAPGLVPEESTSLDQEQLPVQDTLEKQPEAEEQRSSATDSLSLGQLRKFVGEWPRLGETAYDYEYEEVRSFPEELQEWFSYSEDEFAWVMDGKDHFALLWKELMATNDSGSDQSDEETTSSWLCASKAQREVFVGHLIRLTKSPQNALREKALAILVYILLGNWHETAGKKSESNNSKLAETTQQWLKENEGDSEFQIECILENVTQHASILVPALVRNLAQSWAWSDIASDDGLQDDSSTPQAPTYHEIYVALTCLYIIIDASRSMDPDFRGQIRRALTAPDTDFLDLLTVHLATLRWEEPPTERKIPVSKLILLYWKTLMIVFGSLKDLEQVKSSLDPPTSNLKSKDEGRIEFLKPIKATPLDYHIFRQEIISKYPAYTPPRPILPIETEHTSILPPLETTRSRASSVVSLHDQSLVKPANVSILTQPVHIATPAPSPPPSPAGQGGKGSKRQNYQTNQNFPFLYPPLEPDALAKDNHDRKLEDSSSPDSPLLYCAQDTATDTNVLGKKSWLGEFVPSSIVEAGELFAERTHMSRSLRQMWDVREQFVKSERSQECSCPEDTQALGTISASPSGDSRNDVFATCQSKTDTSEQSDRLTTFDQDIEGGRQGMSKQTAEAHLEVVAEYYHKALPHLNSLVSVLWRELFEINANIARRSRRSFAADGFVENYEQAPKNKTKQNSTASLSELLNADPNEHDEQSVEEVASVRNEEISTKAITSVFLILLKWFKVTHILCFEYLSQLLLDANFIPSALKYLTFQDVDKAVSQTVDRPDLDILKFCHMNSQNPPKITPNSTSSPKKRQQPAPTVESNDDEAVPPPIRRPIPQASALLSPPATPPPKIPTERLPADETNVPAVPTDPHIQEPITDYAPRFFLININLLWILQKIVKHKAHRALLLVQYKSSGVLRKTLRVPQPKLRLYTLKLFKAQVPYCGRKWRQSNMRVITAIYLHCRPELRDEWLCGGDVDGSVEDALPLEQACRSLVHWWHMKHYADVMHGKPLAISNACDEHSMDKLEHAEPDEEDIPSMNRHDQGKDGLDTDFFTRELERMGWLDTEHKTAADQ